MPPSCRESLSCLGTSERPFAALCSRRHSGAGSPSTRLCRAILGPPSTIFQPPRTTSELPRSTSEPPWPCKHAKSAPHPPIQGCGALCLSVCPGLWRRLFRGLSGSPGLSGPLFSFLSRRPLCRLPCPAVVRPSSVRCAACSRRPLCRVALSGLRSALIRDPFGTHSAPSSPSRSAGRAAQGTGS